MHGILSFPSFCMAILRWCPEMQRYPSSSFATMIGDWNPFSCISDMICRITSSSYGKRYSLPGISRISSIGIKTTASSGSFFGTSTVYFDTSTPFKSLLMPYSSVLSSNSLTNDRISAAPLDFGAHSVIPTWIAEDSVKRTSCRMMVLKRLVPAFSAMAPATL